MRTIGAMRVPVIERVAPALTGRAEVIGRHTGDDGGIASLVQMEEVRCGPYVRTVMGREDGDVSDQGNAKFMGPPAKLLPLPEEQELQGFVFRHFGVKTDDGLGHGLGFAQGDRAWPLSPGAQAVFLFQGGEERPVIKPGRLASTEGFEGVTEQRAAFRLGDEAPGRQLQEGSTHFSHRSEFDTVLQEGGHHSQVAREQDAVVAEGIEADEQWIAREAGERLVGGVAMAGGAERQHLPQALPGGGQPLEPVMGLGPDFTHAKAAGQ